MKFEHRVTVDAPRQAVQDFLNDVPRAARCLPGVEDVKDLGGDNYEGRIRLRIGPLGLNVNGQAKLDREAEGWKLRGEGRDRRVGTGMSANIEARLTELAPARTEVFVLADVNFSGRLAELGQPLIKRKADAMVQEFAQNLKQALQA